MPCVIHESYACTRYSRVFTYLLRSVSEASHRKRTTFRILTGAAYRGNAASFSATAFPLPRAHSLTSRPCETTGGTSSRKRSSSTSAHRRWAPSACGNQRETVPTMASSSLSCANPDLLRSTAAAHPGRRGTPTDVKREKMCVARRERRQCEQSSEA